MVVSSKSLLQASSALQLNDSMVAVPVMLKQQKSQRQASSRIVNSPEGFEQVFLPRHDPMPMLTIPFKLLHALLELQLPSPTIICPELNF